MSNLSSLLSTLLRKTSFDGLSAPPYFIVLLLSFIINKAFYHFSMLFVLL